MVSDESVEPTMNLWQTYSQQSRFNLTAGSIACLLISLWLAATLNLPATPGYAGSLLQQDSWVFVMGAAWLALFGCTAVGTVLSSRIHYEGGLFCACIGLAGWSVRFGSSRYALLNATGPQVYLASAEELILLFVAIAIAWFVLYRLMSSGLLPSEKPIGEADRDEPLDQKFLAAAAQVVVTMIVMMLICQSDAKLQTLASVGIASYVATLAAHYFIATGPSAWFWVGPLVVGLIGYISQYFSPSDWMIGDVHGVFAALARPLPLDYASLGIAGALMGYWTSREWHRERLESDQEA